VAISFGPFLCSCLNSPACCRAALFFVQENSGIGRELPRLNHKFVAAFFGAKEDRLSTAVFRDRQSFCKCIPQTGSRTNFRGTASLGTSIGSCLPVAAPPMLFTILRSRETLHDTIRTQKRNRRMRAIKIIGFARAARGIGNI